MLLIECPWCGAHHETDFHYGGEAHIARPENPEELSDEDWAEFIFMRSNTKGVFKERWTHSNGCRRWFNVVRDTVSHKILAVYKPGEAPPAIKDGEGRL